MKIPEKEFYKSLSPYIYNNVDLITHILINKCSDINPSFIEFLLASEYKFILINNFEEILSNYYYNLDFKYLIKDENILNKYKNYINNNPKNLIYEIIMNGFLLEKEEVNKEEIYEFIKTIIDELLMYNNINYYDIEFLGAGALSFVVLIGDKVLKL